MLPAHHGVARYGVAVMLIAAALGLRLLLQPWLGSAVPYLQFFPAILLAAWYGGFGPGALATGLGALIAMELFLPPAGLAVSGAGDWLSLSLFVATGLAISWINHRLRYAEAAQRANAQLATTRAERLDAIINTTVDGIIVIGNDGRIEAFNRGARATVRLLGVRGPRAQRQHAHAVAVSRGARRLPGALQGDPGGHHHRHGTRGVGAAPRWQRVSAPSLGGRDDHRRRPEVHRHAARPQPPRAARGPASRQRRRAGGRLSNRLSTASS